LTTGGPLSAELSPNAADETDADVIITSQSMEPTESGVVLRRVEARGYVELGERDEKDRKIEWIEKRMLGETA
jgi:hypothetical protein